MAKNKNNQAIWNTRIKKKTSNLFQKVGSSIDIDKRLYKEDIMGSIAHVEMLFADRLLRKHYKFLEYSWLMKAVKHLQISLSTYR